MWKSAAGRSIRRRASGAGPAAPAPAAPRDLQRGQSNGRGPAAAALGLGALGKRRRTCGSGARPGVDPLGAQASDAGLRQRRLGLRQRNSARGKRRRACGSGARPRAAALGARASGAGPAAAGARRGARYAADPSDQGPTRSALGRFRRFRPSATLAEVDPDGCATYRSRAGRNARRRRPAARWSCGDPSDRGPHASPRGFVVSDHRPRSFRPILMGWHLSRAGRNGRQRRPAERDMHLTHQIRAVHAPPSADSVGSDHRPRSLSSL